MELKNNLTPKADQETKVKLTTESFQKSPLVGVTKLNLEAKDI